MQRIFVILLLLLQCACATPPRLVESSVAERIIDCPTAPGGGPLVLNCR